MGGHYYAYIRSFQDGKWYNFNDSTVSEIDSKMVNEKIQEMYGGDTGTSGYMLQYRKYDPSLKAHEGETEEDKDKPWQNIPIEDDMIPDYLKQEIDEETKDLIEK